MIDYSKREQYLDFFDYEKLENSTVLQCLFESVKNRLDDTIITYKADLNLDKTAKPLERNITGKMLWNNIFKTASALKALGTKEGDVITFSSLTTPELIYTMYACFAIGAIFIPIDLTYKIDDIIEHFKDIKCKLFFAPDFLVNEHNKACSEIDVEKIIILDFKESLPAIVRIGSKIVDIKSGKYMRKKNKNEYLRWHDFINFSNKKIVPLSLDRDRIISLIRTTGTTGKPKLLMHNTANWLAQVYSCSKSGIIISKGDVFMNPTVPWVDMGIVIGVHYFLCSGARMVLDPLWRPELNAKYIIKTKPQIWVGAPGWIDELFTSDTYKEYDMSHFNYVITGGAPLFPHKQKEYQKRIGETGKVVQGFGLSEVTAPSNLDLESEIGSIGKVLPGFVYKIVDHDTLEEVPQGDIGEYMLGAENENLSPVAVGYYNNPSETCKTFVLDNGGKRWVRTGDKVYEKNGSIYWVARYKNTLTYNGFNIDCDKISQVVEELNSVSKAAVIGTIIADGNQMPLVIVEPKNDVEVPNCIETMIAETISIKLPDYYKPLDIIVVDEMPMHSMKIDYTELRNRYLIEGQYRRTRK